MSAQKDELIVNREWRSSFLTGGMRLELKGTCTRDDLDDAAKVLEIALAQIRRECESAPSVAERTEP